MSVQLTKTALTMGVLLHLIQTERTLTCAIPIHRQGTSEGSMMQCANTSDVHT